MVNSQFQTILPNKITPLRSHNHHKGNRLWFRSDKNQYLCHCQDIYWRQNAIGKACKLALIFRNSKILTARRQSDELGDFMKPGFPNNCWGPTLLKNQVTGNHSHSKLRFPSGQKTSCWSPPNHVFFLGGSVAKGCHCYAESQKPRQRVSNADRKVFANPESFCDKLIIDWRISGYFAMDDLDVCLNNLESFRMILKVSW